MTLLAVLAWLAVLILPAVAGFRLIRPRTRWWMQLSIGPVLVFGGFYLLGLAINLFRLPVITVLTGAAVLLIVAWTLVEIVRFRRRRSRSSAGGPIAALKSAFTRRMSAARPAEIVSWALLAVAVITGAALWLRFQAAFFVPPGWDSMAHGYFVEQMVRFNTLDTAAVLSPTPGATDGVASFYPLAYNLVTAVLHVATGMPISQLMLASTTAVAGVILPFSAFFMARKLDRRHPLVAGFVAIASTLPIELYWILESGRINAVLGLALVPGAVLALFWYRRRPKWRDLPVAALALAGITGVHTSELPMVGIMAGLFALGAALHTNAWMRFARWAGWALVAAATGLILLVLLDGNILGAASQRSDTMIPIGQEHIRVRDALLNAMTRGEFLGDFFKPVESLPIYLPILWSVLVMLGCVLTFRRKWHGFLGATAAYLFFIVLYVALLTGKLGPLMILTVPWYQDPGRLAWTLTLLGAIPAGLATGAISGSVGGFIARVVGRVRGRLLRQGPTAPSGLSSDRTAAPSPRGWTRWIAAGLTGCLLTLGGALPPVGAAAAGVNDNKGPVRQDSLAAFEYLHAHLKPGQRVFDDVRVDGALWMYVDFGVPTLFGNSPYVGGEPKSWLERLWLRENLEDIDTNPCVVSLLDKYSVAYVYFGDRFMDDAKHHISERFLRTDSHFTEVFSQKDAHVFAVDLPAVIPSCTADLTPESKSAF